MKFSNKLRNLKRLIPVLVISLTLVTGCQFVGNMATYKDTTKGFVDAVVKADYNKAITFMALEHESAKNTNLDTLKKGLSVFKNLVTQNFGTDLEYSFGSATKTFSTDGVPNTTRAQIQVANQKDFGTFEVIFDDQSNKILNINIVQEIQPIPSMTKFWLFGMLALCIPAFNIYMVRLVKKSDLKRKWTKYLAIILLNTPSISYHAVAGLAFKLISFQFLFGIGFGYMGYSNSIWTFGIPLGGLYWLWKLKKQKSEDTLPIFPEGDLPNEDFSQLSKDIRADN